MRDNPSKKLIAVKKPDNVDIQRRDPKRSALAQEMRYLGDPLKLADNTVNLLKKGQDEKAAEIVRLASKGMSCTVSWNHMIDYEMSKGRITRAMATYNDMKKRGQQPDSHTYTIVLRGLAWHSDYGRSLQRALTVYHSMFAPNSPVKPSIIHTNAALKVCARVGDLDALWGVAARLPTSGPRAPDKATFTTIFNAISRIAFEDGGRVEGESLRENVDRRHKAVLQGRRMWAEIIERWRAGDMALDEELVVAVGRLLLLADVPQDLDDILSLVEQTMGIPRQTRRRHDTDRHRATPGVEDTPEQKIDHTTLSLSTKPERQPFASVDDDFVPGDEFVPVPSVNPMSYARPSQATLSLVLDACVRLRLVSSAQDYWGLLTGPKYSIIPDTANYHMYLRLLRVQRASRQCIELVQEMRDGLGVGPSVPEKDRKGIKGEAGGVQAKTFRIALGACKRDIKNPNVLANAAKLVRMMIDTLAEVDVGVLSMYLEVSVGAAGHDWRAMSSALRGTEIGVRQLKSMFQFGEKDSSTGTDKKSERYHERCREIYAFLNNLVSAYDKLLYGDENQMLKEERKRCHEQKRIVSAWQTDISRQLGIVHGSRHHWGKERQADGKIPEHGSRRYEKSARGKPWQVDGRLSRRGEVGPEAGLVGKEEYGGDRQADEEEEPDWKREALEARRKAERYTQGGANKRMAMAQYLRRLENASL